MSIRAFRRLSRAERRAYISRVQDPLTLRVLEIAFLGAGKVSWAKVACERAQERARFAEAKLSNAVADLRFVMAGGNPCRVCAVKCTFGEGNCKPVWRGEAGADL